MVIYKYPLRIEDSQQVALPRHAVLQHVGLDPSGTPCLWAEVDPEEVPAEREVRIIGTGGQVPGGFYHLGSFVQGPFVWHVYA